MYIHICTYMYLRWLDYTYICTTSPWAPRQGSTLELDELTSTEWIRVFADRYLLTNVWLACWTSQGGYRKLHYILTNNYIIYMIYIYIRVYICIDIYIYTDLYSILVLRIHMLRYFAPIGSLSNSVLWDMVCIKISSRCSGDGHEKTFKFHGVSRSITEYHGISWNIMEYHGISWNITEYHGISWNIMEYHGISGNIISWNIREYHGISWNIMEYHGISGNIMEYQGISRNIMEYLGIKNMHPM